MQPLQETTDREATECAQALLSGVPPVMWFLRSHMRRSRVAGLSVPQFRMLILLDRCPTATLSLAAEHLGCSLPSASRLISGLVTKGFVRRASSDNDRRALSLELSAAGRVALAKAQGATLKAMAGKISPLNRAERRVVARAMMALQGIFGDDRQRGPITAQVVKKPRRAVAVSGA